MAMQLSISRLLLLVGTGYTGTILVKNGKLSELIGELERIVKGIEKSGEQDGGDSDAIAQQVRRLAMDVRQLASNRQITVLNGNSGQNGNLANLVIPAAALGAVGYGYMWWKGIKFSDLMYVTKRSMATAVSNLTKHLEQVTEALSAAKKHLTQRIQLLDDKMESQKEISKAIQKDVNAASENLAQIGSDLTQLQGLISGLDWKIGTLEEKQDIANMGVMYLCNFVGGKKLNMPKALQDQLKTSGRTRSSLTYSEVPSLMGLKELADNLSRGISEPPSSNVISQDGIENLENQPRVACNDSPKTLMRFNSARC